MTTHPAFDQRVHHLLHDLCLSQQSLLDRHDAKFPAGHGLASLNGSGRRLGRAVLAALVATASGLLHLVVDRRRVAHIPVGFGLDAYGIVFELTVCAYASVKVL